MPNRSLRGRGGQGKKLFGFRAMSEFSQVEDRAIASDWANVVGGELLEFSCRSATLAIFRLCHWW